MFLQDLGSVDQQEIKNLVYPVILSKNMIRLGEKSICTLLNKAAIILNCKMAHLKGCPRVAAADKDRRDILIYLLWETGKYTNMRIGDLFGLTYSSISRRVKITKSRIRSGDELMGQYETLKSQIKA
jgi:chromosomal replication initiation ATPase DnaA